MGRTPSVGDPPSLTKCAAAPTMGVGPLAVRARSHPCNAATAITAS
jgi:hypothetical protein